MYENYKADGYKQLITLKCPPNMTKKDLRNWWFEHGERVKKLQALKFYAIYFNVEDTQGPPPDFDSYEELRFDSLDDLRNAYESAIWQDELIDMEKKHLYHPEYFQGTWLEGNVVKMKGYEKIPTHKGCYRLFGSVKRPSTMTRKDFKDWFYNLAMRVIDSNGVMQVPGIIWWTHDYNLINSPYGPSFADCVASDWYYSFDEIKKEAENELMKAQFAYGLETIDFYNPKVFQSGWAEQFVIKAVQQTI